MKNEPWKPILIVLVLGLCVWALYPPRQKLRPGLDLAGGTRLVYEVDVPANRSAKEAVEQVIRVLKKRVDPDGTRNLIWRPLAGNRFEVQMALASVESKAKSRAYNAALKQLFRGNVSPSALDAAMESGDKRPGRLKELAGDDDAKRDLLNKAAEVFDAMAEAREPYQTVQQQLRKAQADLAKLPADASEATRQSFQDNLTQLQEELTAATRAFLDARKVYEAARHDALATNISRIEFEQILKLPDLPLKAEDGTSQSSLRQQALDELMARHPDRADEIRQVAELRKAYDAVRGELEDPNDLKAMLRGSGVLSFRIAPAPADVPDLQEKREQLQKRGPMSAGEQFRWCEIDDPASFTEKSAELKELKEDPQTYFAAKRGLVAQAYGDKYYMLLWDTLDKSLTQAQPNWKLTSARQQTDQSGFPGVGFALNTAGGNYMGRLTNANVGKPMAIVLDDRVISAPTIQSQIFSRGIITGGRSGFTAKELNYLLNTLNAGSLTAGVSRDPVSEKTISPLYGADNLQHGLQAAVWALILVAGFMAVYYLFWGGLADFALLANMAVILGVMSLREATFTLPGIAGIVLTIGMAVDANVLIFERIREELEGGGDLVTAIRLGYEKALSTIIDANLTTLITCLVLGYTATAEVKGFAVTLGIGICATLFTALFCTRVIVNLWVTVLHSKRLPMTPTLIPALGRLLRPKIDWVGRRGLFFAVSLILMIGGVVAVYTRGQDLLDIEFRSGTLVSFHLQPDKALTLPEARERCAQVGGQLKADAQGDPEALVFADEIGRAKVLSLGEPVAAGDDAGKLKKKDEPYGNFSIAVLSQDSAAVQDAITRAFDDVLQTPDTISFAGENESDHTAAPVYAIRDSSLGVNINRPGLPVDVNVTDYRGGVAIVLENLEPAQTIEDLEDRVTQTRMQPNFEGLGSREVNLIGVDRADDGDPNHFKTVVVLTRDNKTNYVDAAPKVFAATGGLAQTEWEVIRYALTRKSSLESVSNFSSQVSATMKQQAISALFLSLLAVVVYIWLRFGSLRYGLAAIAALVHDVLIALGLVAASAWLAGFAGINEFRIDLTLVAAFLTIVGYSLNDTIVVFDRIRENRGKLAVASPAIINDSINQCFSRTVLTSGSTLLALFTLFIFGGPGVHAFAYTMIIGVVIGTYSSVAIASSILLIGQGGAPQPAPGVREKPVPA